MAQSRTDEVIESRRRLTRALESLLSDKPFAKITVADIVGRAGSSRRGFAEHFDTPESCLLALLKDVTDEGVASVSSAVDDSTLWRIQIRQLVEAWFAFVDARPEIMLSQLRDVPTLGEPGRELLAEDNDAYLELIETITAGDAYCRSGGAPMSRVRALILLGGLQRLAAVAVRNGTELAEDTEDAVQTALLLAAP